jgi:parallel beta-helix repeat protein
LTATGNYVQGAGVVASGGAAQNGIEVAFGAVGKITSNTVIDNIYGDPTVAASADILLYDAGTGVTVSTNTLGNSQIPLGIESDTAGEGDGAIVSTNKIFGTYTYDAIDVCSNNNSIKTNTIFNSAESGIHFDAGCGTTGNNNTATGNTFVESFCAGILSDPGTSGNSTGTETYEAVPFTLATTTSRCTIPPGPQSQSKNKAEIVGGSNHASVHHKFSPAR